MMRKSGFTLIELLMASVVLAVIAAIAIPNFTRAQRRAKEAEVKSVAHSLQMAAEDYKTCPSWLGLKPENAGQIAHVVTSYLPRTVQAKRNPFNPAQSYGVYGEGIGGGWSGAGKVFYFATVGNQALPYTIGAFGEDPNVAILTLMEEGY